MSLTLNAEKLNAIADLSGLGLTVQEVAVLIGVAESNLRLAKENDPLVERAFAVGQARADEAVSQKLYEKCMEGDFQSIRWWEQTRMGRRATAPSAPPGQESSTLRLQVLYDDE